MSTTPKEKREHALRVEAVSCSIDPNWQIGQVDAEYDADRAAVELAATMLRESANLQESLAEKDAEIQRLKGELARKEIVATTVRDSFVATAEDRAEAAESALAAQHAKVRELRRQVQIDADAGLTCNAIRWMDLLNLTGDAPTPDPPTQEPTK